MARNSGLEAAASEATAEPDLEPVAESGAAAAAADDEDDDWLAKHLKILEAENNK